MILFCEKANPSSSQPHECPERQGHEVAHDSASSGFREEGDLGAAVGEGWPSEHTFYFLHFSIVWIFSSNYYMFLKATWIELLK